MTAGAASGTAEADPGRSYWLVGTAETLDATAERASARREPGPRYAGAHMELVAQIAAHRVVTGPAHVAAARALDEEDLTPHAMSFAACSTPDPGRWWRSGNRPSTSVWPSCARWQSSNAGSGWWHGSWAAPAASADGSVAISGPLTYVSRRSNSPVGRPPASSGCAT